VCGSCWAFIITDLISNLTILLTNGKFKKPLSTQNLLNCYKPKVACEGQSPEDIFIWLDKTRKKLTTEEKVPYLQLLSVDVTDNCINVQSGINIKRNSVRSICTFIPEFGYDEKILKENINNMKKTLFLNGPFYASISVYPDFMKFDGKNIYESVYKQNEQIGGHAILIVGYCNKNIDTRSGFEDGYWICKNSWGKNWAVYSFEPGYFYIKMGNNTCGIESRCGIAYPNIPMNKKINLSKFRIQKYKTFLNYITK